MKRLLSGNEAIAQGAWEAGVRVACAYPGTPSTEVLENLVRFEEVDAEWSPNEKVAFEVAYGAAVGGARSIVSMKHVGLNVAADPLMTSSYAGVNAGFVIYVADDPGMHSSQNEQDTRRFAKFAKVPILELSEPQEALWFVKFAFELSERFDTPVIVRSTTRLSHTRAPVEVGEREDVPLRPYVKDQKKYIMIPAHARRRHEVVEKRIKEISEFSNSLNLHQWIKGDSEIGVITAGVPYLYAREAFKGASFLKLALTWPLPEKLIRKFVESVKKVYVVEELEPFLEEELRLMGVEVEDTSNRSRTGELTVEAVKSVFLGQSLRSREPYPSVPRPPALCPGCPHTGVFWVLGRLKTTVTGDIGCYTLGALPPHNAMDTTIEMGASIGMAFGLEKARGKDFSKKTVAVIGESTFIHSGITGLIDIVYNKGHTNVVIMDNRTTGMTGHQDNPATGRTAKGEETKELDIEKLVRAIGIENVITVDPHDLKHTKRVLQKALDSPEPSVVISKRPCVLLPEERKRTSQLEPMWVNPEECRGEKCKVCLTLGCPAIGWKDGKAVIDPLLCTSCELCMKLCPYKAIKESAPDREVEVGLG